MVTGFAAFLKRFMIYTLVIWAAFALAKPYIPEKFLFPNTVFLIVFFFASTAALHYGMLSSARNNNRSIVVFYMLSTAFKLLLYIAVIIGFALARPAIAVAFISNFFVLYVFFTVYEVQGVYHYFKSKPSVSSEKPA
jgi:hypothetical protein